MAPSVPMRQLPILAILLVSFALSATALGWGLPSDNKTWAFDEIPPWEVTRAAKLNFANGWHANYPPLHYRLLHLVNQGVRLHVDDDWAGLAAGERLSRLRSAHRWVSVIMATLMVWGIYRCARLLGGRNEARLTALIAASCLPLTYYAKIANVDVPYLFWFVGSLFFLGQAVRRERLRDHVLMAVTAMAAIATKDQAFALYVPVPVILIVLSYRRTAPVLGGRRRLAQALGDRRVLVTAAVAVLSFAVLMNVVANWSGFLSHIHRLRTVSVSRFDVYPPTLEGHLEMAWQSVKHLAFAMSWPMLALSLAGVAAVLARPARQRLRTIFLVCGASYYLLFISVIRHNYVRFLIPIAFILSFAAALALVRLWESRMPRAVVVGLAGAVLLFALARPIALDRLLLTDSKYSAESWIRSNVPPGARVGGVGRLQMLPRGLSHIPWKNVYGKRPRSLNSFDYLVFGRSNFWATREEAVWSEFQKTESPFALRECFVSAPPWPMPSTEGIYTNLDKVSPEICVLQRDASF